MQVLDINQFVVKMEGEPTEIYSRIHVSEPEESFDVFKIKIDCALKV